MAYIDLNPFAANVCKHPEGGRHTTLDARLNGEPVRIAKVSESTEVNEERPRKRLVETIYERRGWWLAIGSDASLQHAKDKTKHHSLSRSILPGAGLTFRGYLKLLDATARLLRDGKKCLPADTQAITDRLTATPARIAAEVRYWLEHGLCWANLERP